MWHQLKIGERYKRILAKSYSSEVEVISFNDKVVLYKPCIKGSHCVQCRVKTFLNTFKPIDSDICEQLCNIGNLI